MGERNETTEHALDRVIIPISFLFKAKSVGLHLRGSVPIKMWVSETTMRQTGLLRAV